jgi:hypothetical protein
MATRYEVRWIELPDTWRKRGFAFRPGAVEFFADLCDQEREGAGVGGAVLEYLGPNGERREYPCEESVPQ